MSDSRSFDQLMSTLGSSSHPVTLGGTSLGVRLIGIILMTSLRLPLLSISAVYEPRSETLLIFSTETVTPVASATSYMALATVLV